MKLSGQMKKELNDIEKKVKILQKDAKGDLQEDDFERQTMNDYLRRLTAAVDRELLDGIDPRHGTLEAAMHYALTVSGKRLRPLLFLALLDACGTGGGTLHRPGLGPGDHPYVFADPR